MNYLKIRNFEAICLLIVLVINHIVINAPQMILNHCASSSILNVVYITLLILIIGFIILKLFKNFVDFDILDISEYVGGKILKIIVGVLCIIYLIVESGFLVSTFSENLLLIYFTQFPLSFVIFFFLLVAVVSSFLGDKAIIKTNTILTPIAIISLLVTFITVSGSFDPERMFPFLGNGLNETFFSGASNIFAFNGLFFLFFITPMLSKKEDTSKITLISIIMCAILLLLSVISLLFAFPDIYSIGRLSPIYFIVLNANFGDFIQRPEILFILTWMLSLMSFLNIAIMFILKIFKKMTNVKHTQVLSLAFVSIVYVIASIPKNMFDLNSFLNIFYQYGTLILVFGVFTVILIIANIKQKKKKIQNVDINNLEAKNE